MGNVKLGKGTISFTKKAGMLVLLRFAISLVSPCSPYFALIAYTFITRKVPAISTRPIQINFVFQAPCQSGQGAGKQPPSGNPQNQQLIPFGGNMQRGNLRHPLSISLIQVLAAPQYFLLYDRAFCDTTTIVYLPVEVEMLQRDL